MAELVLSLLGSFEARTPSGDALTFPTRKTKALLAYLALHQNTLVGREALRRLLWSDRDVEHGRSSLRQAVKALHQSIGPLATAMHTDRSKVGFIDAPIDLDVAHFESAARTDDPAELEHAARLYRGDFLADLDIPDPAFRAWRTRETARLRRTLTDALEKLLTHQRDALPVRAVETARCIVAVDPCHEAAHAFLIAHHRALGQITAAAEQYETLWTALDAIGAVPSDETQSLYKGSPDRPVFAYAQVPAVPAAAAPEPPSIAVLPFGVLDEDKAHAYFADGVTEDILTALSRLPWLTVIARGSTFTYRGSGVDLGEVSRNLGVRYVLQGSVRRSGDRIRIAGRLSDTAHGRVLWADHFDSELREVFDLQDKVTEGVIGAIAPRIEAAEIERARAKRPEDLDAWDLYLQALPFHYSMTREGHGHAIRLLRASLERDPRFAPALGIAAWAYTLRVPQQWGDNQPDVDIGLDFARRAVAAGEEHPDALAMGGYALAYLARDLDSGLQTIDRALAMNSNAARAFAFSGWVRGYAGDHETAIAHYRRALRLSPRDQLGFRTRAGLAYSLFFQGQLQEAAAEARQAHHEAPSYIPAHRVLAATLACLGRIEEAQEIVRRARAILPELSTSYAIAECRYSRPEDVERLKQGYLRAGLPE